MTAWELLRELWSVALDAARSPERFLRRRRALKRIDAAMRRSKPLPPATLLDARQETIHRDVGRGRAAKTPRSRPPRSPPEE